MIAPVSRSKKKRVSVALMIGMYVASCAASLMARNAVSQGRVPPLALLWRSLGARPGVYYLASPEIVTSALDIRAVHVDERVKQLKLGEGYVMVYGNHEKLFGRASLAKESMQIIRSHLAGHHFASKEGAQPNQWGCLKLMPSL